MISCYLSYYVVMHFNALYAYRFLCSIKYCMTGRVAMSCVLNTMSPRVVQHFVNNGGNDVITQAVKSTTISTFEQHACLAILPQYLQILLGHDIQYLARRLVRDRHELQAPFDLSEPLPEKLQKQDKVLEILQYL